MVSTDAQEISKHSQIYARLCQQTKTFQPHLISCCLCLCRWKFWTRAELIQPLMPILINTASCSYLSKTFHYAPQEPHSSPQYHAHFSLFEYEGNIKVLYSMLMLFYGHQWSDVVMALFSWWSRFIAHNAIVMAETGDQGVLHLIRNWVCPSMLPRGDHD